mmetsp:Transcript_63481/g.169834  ORF Transcript_63481/g.169834 Transcript_63481/m.169834 type:complete len:866 (-) Transcript_63481:501-3098(-)
MLGLLADAGSAASVRVHAVAVVGLLLALAVLRQERLDPRPKRVVGHQHVRRQPLAAEGVCLVAQQVAGDARAVQDLAARRKQYRVVHDLARDRVLELVGDFNVHQHVVFGGRVGRARCERLDKIGKGLQCLPIAQVVRPQKVQSLVEDSDVVRASVAHDGWGKLRVSAQVAINVRDQRQKVLRAERVLLGVRYLQVGHLGPRDGDEEVVKHARHAVAKLRHHEGVWHETSQHLDHLEDLAARLHSPPRLAALLRQVALHLLALVLRPRRPSGLRHLCLDLLNFAEVEDALVDGVGHVVEHHIDEPHELLPVLALELDGLQVGRNLGHVQQKLRHVVPIVELFVELIVRASDLNVDVKLNQGRNERPTGDVVVLEQRHEVAAAQLEAVPLALGDEHTHGFEQLAAQVRVVYVQLAAGEGHKEVEEVVEDGYRCRLEHRGVRHGDEADHVQHGLHAVLGHRLEFLRWRRQRHDGRRRLGEVKERAARKPRHGHQVIEQLDVLEDDLVLQPPLQQQRDLALQNLALLRHVRCRPEGLVRLVQLLVDLVVVLHHTAGPDHVHAAQGEEEELGDGAEGRRGFGRVRHGAVGVEGGGGGGGAAGGRVAAVGRLAVPELLDAGLVAYVDPGGGGARVGVGRGHQPRFARHVHAVLGREVAPVDLERLGVVGVEEGLAELEHDGQEVEQEAVGRRPHHQLAVAVGVGGRGPHLVVFERRGHPVEEPLRAVFHQALEHRHQRNLHTAHQHPHALHRRVQVRLGARRELAEARLAHGVPQRAHLQAGQVHLHFGQAAHAQEGAQHRALLQQRRLHHPEDLGRVAGGRARLHPLRRAAQRLRQALDLRHHCEDPDIGLKTSEGFEKVELGNLVDQL